MKMKNKISGHPIIIIALVMFIGISCKKNDNNPEIPYGSMTDQAGNIYKTIEIGSQTWMAENLKTTKYNDNKDIPNVTGNSAWSNLTTPAYSWYDNDEAKNKPLYGALYNWFTVNTGKLCPTGWHVPTDTEFKTLETYLGMSVAQADGISWRGTDQGTQLKNSSGWKAGENGTNISGFSALPGGYRFQQDGAFNNKGELSYWWSSNESGPTKGYYRRLDGSNAGVYRESAIKTAGKYIRCVKD
jgi:uncharacterized protein (TIGR02145 family)